MLLLEFFLVFFLNCYLAAPRSTLHFGPLSRGQPHPPDANHCVLHFRPEGRQEPKNSKLITCYNTEVLWARFHLCCLLLLLLTLLNKQTMHGK